MSCYILQPGKILFQNSVDKLWSGIVVEVVGNRVRIAQNCTAIRAKLYINARAMEDWFRSENERLVSTICSNVRRINNLGLVNRNVNQQPVFQAQKMSCAVGLCEISPWMLVLKRSGDILSHDKASQDIYRPGTIYALGRFVAGQNVPRPAQPAVTGGG